MWSMAPAFTALRGIPGEDASSGSCAIVIPPPCLTASMPAVPSSSVPVNTTATTRDR
jgi:hypothetical protein